MIEKILCIMLLVPLPIKIIYNPLTLNPSFASYGCFKYTGAGHVHLEKTRKNFSTKVEAVALG